MFSQPSQFQQVSNQQDTEHSVTFGFSGAIDQQWLAGRIAYSWVGNRSLPVVVILGGLSANRFIVDQLDKQGQTVTKGWWNEFVIDHQAIDFDRFSLLSLDYIGGCGETTLATPTDNLAISTFDQANGLRQLLEQLDITQLEAVIGTSYGGMVSLVFAALYPELLKQQIVICAAHRSYAQSTGFRLIQRKIVELAQQLGDGDAGLSLARSLGTLCYRSADEYEQRFSGQSIDQGVNVEALDEYLSHKGKSFSGGFTTEAFLRLSASIDQHHINPALITTDTTLIPFVTDQLVLLEQVKELAENISGKVKLLPIDTLYGHDAFLKEFTQLTTFVKTCLKGDCHD